MDFIKLTFAQEREATKPATTVRIKYKNSTNFSNTDKKGINIQIKDKTKVNINTTSNNGTQIKFAKKLNKLKLL